jgi:hypothetical protein
MDDQTEAGETRIRPFRIDIPQEDLDDLRTRLAATRWPDQLPGTGWDYGIPLEVVRDLAGYWRDGYDWRVHKRRLNAFARVLPVGPLTRRPPARRSAGRRAPSGQGRLEVGAVTVRVPRRDLGQAPGPAVVRR